MVRVLEVYQPISNESALGKAVRQTVRSFAAVALAPKILRLVICVTLCYVRTDRRICNWISDGGAVVIFQPPLVPRVRHTGDTRNFFDYPEQNWENWSFRDDEVSKRE